MYPLTHNLGERPDFVLELGGQSVGVEGTEASRPFTSMCQLYARPLCASRLAPLPSGT
jgi:hypothetical protein